MYRTGKALFLKVITPMHVGSGSDLGIVDLPIQRESHTTFPKIESSSLKGAIRDRFESVSEKRFDDIRIHLCFGYDDAHISEETENDFSGKKGTLDSQFAGALGFSDARLLFFPVKSVSGVYALATCPEVLSRLGQDLEVIQRLTGEAHASTLIDHIKAESISIKKGGCIVSRDTSLEVNSRVILEEYAFKPEYKSKELLNELSAYFEGTIPNLGKKLVILSDDDFRDFVNLSTEVITRIKIDNETGTVAAGALFSEEFLPSESVLYSLTFAAPIFQAKQDVLRDKLGEMSLSTEGDVLKYFTDTLEKSANNILQIGGGATLGKGLISIIH